MIAHLVKDGFVLFLVFAIPTVLAGIVALIINSGAKGDKP